MDLKICSNLLAVFIVYKNPKDLQVQNNNFINVKAKITMSTLSLRTLPKDVEIILGHAFLILFAFISIFVLL